MFSKISMLKDITKALYYNEQKTEQGVAECILAENYLKEAEHMSIKEKSERLNERSALNEHTIVKGLHLSLNFDAADNLSNALMKILAKKYMEGIGFGQQPYLVYRHNDSSHPHMHIVATCIRENGLRLPLFYKLSKKVTKDLSNEFFLKKVRKATSEELEEFKVTKAQQIVHGQSRVKRSVSDVLNTVIPHYGYASLNELNAILKLYNVTARPGKERHDPSPRRGLHYHVLDANGHITGMPIKASSFALKATLADLEKRFVLNEHLQTKHRQHVRAVVDWALAGEKPAWQEFIRGMEEERISVVLNTAKKNGPEEAYFVDHPNKTVFSGENLGAIYKLNAIQARCIPEEQVRQQDKIRQEEVQRIQYRLNL